MSKTFYVRVDAKTDEDVNYVYELLEKGTLRGDVVPEQEYGPTLAVSLVDQALFILGRINSKLDNLGQVRHLYTINKELGKLNDSLVRIINPLNVMSWPALKEYVTDMNTLGQKPHTTPTLSDAIRFVESSNGGNQE